MNYHGESHKSVDSNLPSLPTEDRKPSSQSQGTNSYPVYTIRKMIAFTSNRCCNSLWVMTQFRLELCCIRKFSPCKWRKWQNYICLGAVIMLNSSAWLILTFLGSLFARFCQSYSFWDMKHFGQDVQCFPGSLTRIWQIDDSRFAADSGKLIILSDWVGKRMQQRVMADEICSKCECVCKLGTFRVQQIFQCVWKCGML